MTFTGTAAHLVLVAKETDLGRAMELRNSHARIVARAIAEGTEVNPYALDAFRIWDARCAGTLA